MDDFKFSEDLDGRVFCTNLSGLEERLDPLFYIAVKNIKENIVNKAKYECVDLIKTCTINRGRFGHRPRNDPRFYDGQYPFIQTGDIVKAAESNASIEYTQTLNELGLKTSKLFEPPKLLFTIAANIGDTAILDYPSCFPDSVVALIPKKNNLSLEYLNAYLTLIKPYIVELAPYSAQRNLNNQQLALVPVIIPPKDIQESIFFKMELAYSEKKQKEAEAQQLLDSIDDYLLAELGIELPEQEENTLQSRIFTRRLKEVSGSRFDTYFNMPLFSKIEKKIHAGMYDCAFLGELVVPIGGVTYKATDERQDGHKILRSNNITLNTNELNFEKIRYIDSNINISEVSKLYKNDILMSSASGSKEHVGKVAFIEECMDFYFGAFMTVLRAKNTAYSSNYLFNFLSSKIYRLMLFRFLGGTNINNVGFEKIKNFLIPLPPIGKQTEIANHITQIRNQAKQLQQQAKAELEQAKKQVEAMILGEA